MRKNIFTLLAVVTMGLALQAQDYNKWSIDADFGANRPGKHISKGYSLDMLNLFHAGLNARYMINTKFGFSFGLDYDKFQNKDDSPEFESYFYRPNIQMVANLGHILGIEDLSRNLGLLGHLGGGIGILGSEYLDDKDLGQDKLVFLTAGLRPQIKLGERVALFMDASVFVNMMEQKTFDTHTNIKEGGIDGYGYTASIGLSINLGGNDKHSDWFFADFEKANREQELQNQIDRLKKDVVTLRTTADDTQNNITENDSDIEDLKERIANASTQKEVEASADAVRDLLEKELINIHFGFDSATPDESALWLVGVVANYMSENPSHSITLNGYADERGNTLYNNKLSQRRADKVKELLVSLGVDASRITAEGKGVRTTGAHSLARKVLVKLNK